MDSSSLESKTGRSIK